MDSPDKTQRRELKGVQVTALSINNRGFGCLGGSRGELTVWEAAHFDASPRSLNLEAPGAITTLNIDDKAKLTAIDERGNVYGISIAEEKVESP